MRRSFGVLLLAACLLVGLLVPARAADQPPVTVLVHGAHGQSGAAVAALKSLDLPVVHRMDAIGVVVTTGPAATVARLARDSRIERVEREPSPMQFHLDTSLQSIRAGDAQEIKTAGPQGFAVPFDGSGITIAVIDQGIDGSHPMFRLPDGSSSVVRNLELLCLDRYPVAGNRDICGTAGVEDTTVFADVTGLTNSSEGPLEGHGTHVASTAAGQRITTTDGRTLQGVAPGARLVGLGVTNEISVTWGGIAGLHWVIQNHRRPCGGQRSQADCPPIRVVNNSWGYPDAYDPNSALAKAIKGVLDSGVAIAWSAGNSGESEGDRAATNSAGHTPQQGVVSVASYNDSDLGDRDGYLSGFSSRGMRGAPETYPDLSAPGDAITAACRPYLGICGSGADARDPNYNTISGTSMASPHVAGAIAVLLQANPALRPADVERILEASAYPFRGRGRYEPDPLHPGGLTSYDKGHGLLDLAGALAQATGRAEPALSQSPNRYKPAAPKGAAAIGSDYTWRGGPLGGVNASGCKAPDRVGECDYHPIRIEIPDGGADIFVTVSWDASAVGVELFDPRGLSAVKSSIFYIGPGDQTIETTGYLPGVWTVGVWSQNGAVPAYRGEITLSKPVD